MKLQFTDIAPNSNLTPLLRKSMKCVTLSFLLVLLTFNVFAASEDDFELEMLDTIRTSSLFGNAKVIDLRAQPENAGYIKAGPFIKKCT